MPISVQVTETGKGSPTYSFEKDLNGSLTFEQLENFTKNAVISISKQVLKEEQGKGFDKKPRVRVDNVFERKVEQVKPFGKVEYFARVDFSVAILRMFEFILERSPRSTGQYISGNLVFVNGIEVARSVGSLKRYLVVKAQQGGFKDSDEIRFLNANPYARRLENKGIRRGVKGKFANKNMKGGRRRRRSAKTGNLIQQPNGAYFLAYRTIRRRFKQIAQFLRFTFLPNGSKGIYVRPEAGQRNTFKKDGRPYLYPTIVLKLSGAGIKGEQVFE